MSRYPYNIQSKVGTGKRRIQRMASLNKNRGEDVTPTRFVAAMPGGS